MVYCGLRGKRRAMVILSTIYQAMGDMVYCGLRGKRSAMVILRMIYQAMGIWCTVVSEVRVGQWLFYVRYTRLWGYGVLWSQR